MRPLRILHVTPYYEHAWGYGGIPRLASALARGLARRGHAVTVCTTDACDDRSRLARTSRQSAPDEGVSVRVFPNVSNALAYRLQFFTPVGMSAYLRRHAADFDVAHLHACHNLPGILAARHLRRARIPYLVAPNGTAPRIERRRTAKLLFDRTAGRRLLPGAARVLAVADAERAQLAALGIDRARVELVPNPVDLDEFEPPVERGRFRARAGLAGPIVLFLGMLTPRKRVDVLVRAFAALGVPGAALAIAGGDMGAGNAARRLAADLGVSASTRFVGLLRGRDRLDALADADVVVYPSEHEIFGLVPIEALLCGTPVVVSNDSGCGAIVASLGGGLTVPTGDVAALTAAIACVLHDPAGWRTAAAAAAGRARLRFGAESICERLEQVYFRIVSNGGGAIAP